MMLVDKDAEPNEAPAYRLGEDTQYSDGLWFEDGSLIIETDDTLFKVYKAILSARSPVFREMVAYADSPDSESTFEGCTYLHLFDSATDMTHFLKAIFDSEFFEAPPASSTLAIVVGVLKLSHKYDVKYLRRRALAHLSSAYPTTLTAWDFRHHAPPRTLPTPSDLNDHLSVIAAANTAGAPWVLPAAIYSCCVHLAPPAPNPECAGTPALVTATQARLRAAQYRLLHALAAPLGGRHGCATADTCALARVVAFVARVAQQEGDPLAGVPDAAWARLSERACDQCYVHAKGVFRAWREGVWAALPGMAGLPAGEWVRLEELKEDVLGCYASSPGLEAPSGYSDFSVMNPFDERYFSGGSDSS